MRHTVAREIILDADLRNVSEIKYTRYSATSNEALTDTIKAKTSSSRPTRSRHRACC